LRQIYVRVTAPFTAIPHDLIALLARVCVGAVFLRSGLLKYASWENTLFLFETQYALPVIPFPVAAYLATAAELVFPVLLFAGFLTRFAALALLIMTLVIQVFVYPNAFDTHGGWAVAFLYLMKFGAGYVSLDYLLFGDRPPRVAGISPA
jgi:putative oxidoreductase